jgi:hypothetical protein
MRCMDLDFNSCMLAVVRYTTADIFIAQLSVIIMRISLAVQNLKNKMCTYIEFKFASQRTLFQ